MAITFDPANKRIVLDSSYAAIKDIYSRWKEWVQTGSNSRYPQAFTVVGGDPLGGGLFVASYFFLENGWRIRPMEANHVLILDGSINVQGGGSPVVQTLGTFNVSTQYTVPVQAQGIETSGGGGSTPAEIAAAVRSELSAELAKISSLTFTVAGKVDSNLKYVKDQQVVGTGTEANPWGPL